jgi:hypothetical protein
MGYVIAHPVNIYNHTNSKSNRIMPADAAGIALFARMSTPRIPRVPE